MNYKYATTRGLQIFDAKLLVRVTVQPRDKHRPGNVNTNAPLQSCTYHTYKLCHWVALFIHISDRNLWNVYFVLPFSWLIELRSFKTGLNYHSLLTLAERTDSHRGADEKLERGAKIERCSTAECCSPPPPKWRQGLESNTDSIDLWTPEVTRRKLVNVSSIEHHRQQRAVWLDTFTSQ